MPSPTPEDIIVFYEPDSMKFTERCHTLSNAGFVQVDSFNPYWNTHGKTFTDRDGYRIVIQNDEWSNVVAA